MADEELPGDEDQTQGAKPKGDKAERLISQIDLFMGGLAEKHAKNALVGETFQAIIASQFRNLRTGDRFFWQNEGFSPEISYQDAAQRHHCSQYGYAKLAG